MHQVARSLGIVLLAGVVALSASTADAKKKKKKKGKPAATATVAKDSRWLTHDDVKARAKSMTKAFGMADDVREKVLKRLDEVLGSDDFAAVREHKDLRGVFVYKVGEGGLLIKIKKGEGKLWLKGAKEELPIRMKSTSFGAQVGGSAEWGVGLVFALDDDRLFGGDYKGDTKGAAAGKTGFSTTRLRRVGAVGETTPHGVYMLGAAKGLSANSAGAKLTFEVDWPEG